jgi:hypothetical protein
MRKTMLLLVTIAGLLLIGLAPKSRAAQTQSADLAIAGSADYPNAGGATYTVTAKNKGPDSASGVTVTGGAGAAIVSIGTSQGTCAIVDGNNFSCNVGALADDAKVDIGVQADVPNFGEHQNTITYCGFAASVQSTTYDPGPGPSSVTVCIMIPPN